MAERYGAGLLDVGDVHRHGGVSGVAVGVGCSDGQGVSRPGLVVKAPALSNRDLPRVGVDAEVRAAGHGVSHSVSVGVGGGHGCADGSPGGGVLVDLPRGCSVQEDRRVVTYRVGGGCVGLVADAGSVVVAGRGLNAVPDVGGGRRVGRCRCAGDDVPVVAAGARPGPPDVVYAAVGVAEDRGDGFLPPPGSSVDRATVPGLVYVQHLHGDVRDGRHGQGVLGLGLEVGADVLGEADLAVSGLIVKLAASGPESA